MQYRRLTWLCVTAFLTITLQACQMEIPFEDESSRHEIEQLMAQKKFAEAREKLNHAETKIAVSYKTSMEINRAMIDMAENKYETASQALGILLNDPETPSDDLKWLHFFKGVSDMELYTSRKIDNFKLLFEALEHFYIADSMGLPCRSQIGKILKENVMRCEAFQPEPDRLASSPSGALAFREKTKSVVCPHHSVWLKFDARPHEIITPTVVFNALDRILWPDESSQLPFSNAQIRIYPSDAQDRPLDTPILEYQLPLAESIPSAEEYMHFQPELASFTSQPGASPYYVELSTARMGEVSAEIRLKYNADCHILDDKYTWSDDFKAQRFEPTAGEMYTNMLLCPSRPDTISVHLNTGESAMLLLHPLDDANLSWNITKDNKSIASGKQADLMKDDSPESAHIHASHDTEYHVHVPRPQDDTAQQADWLPSPILFILTNTGTPANYDLSFTDPQPIQYHFQYVKSFPCDPNAASTVYAHELKLPVSDDIHNKPIFTYNIGWQCAKDSQEFKPIFDNKNLTGRYDVYMTSFHIDHSAEGEFSFESVLRTQESLNYMDLPAEKGEPSASKHWFNTSCQHALALKRPLTSQSVLKYSSTIPTFWALTLLPQDDRNQVSENNDKQDDQSEEKKNSKEQDPSQEQDQERKSDSGDHENDAPEEQADSQASPQGPGEDTAGNQSKPDPSRNNDPQASSQSLESYEKRRLDETLDGQEAGVMEIPNSGITTGEEAEDEMPW